MNDWYRRLGVAHRERDEAAGHDARAAEAGDRQRHVALRRRWPAITAAIRDLSNRYNEGAGLEALIVVDDASDESRDPSVQILAGGGQTLTMTLVGVELCVRTTPGTPGAADDGRRWLTFAPTDEATAASAVQYWLTQL
jgi:hypothetical protein